MSLAFDLWSKTAVPRDVEIQPRPMYTPEKIENEEEEEKKTIKEKERKPWLSQSTCHLLEKRV